MAATIYRLLPFTRFKEVAEAQSLAFVTYDMWPEDPYEGFLLRLLELEEGRRQIVLYMQCMPSHLRPTVGPFVITSLMQRYRRMVHLQSWTACPESNLMWKAYSHNRSAVRISTTLEKVRQLPGIRDFAVKYTDTLYLEEELDRVVRHNKFDPQSIFASKRIEFKHEEEIRLVTQVDNDYAPIAPTMAPSVIEIDQLFKVGLITAEEKEDALNRYDPCRKSIKPVSIAHVNQFIESVLVHPEADDSLVTEVREFCKAKNIHFLGRSQMNVFRF